MNRSGKGTNLTFLLIGIIVFIGTMLLIYSPNVGILNNFATDNQKTIDSNYANAYNNLTSQKSSLTSFSDTYSFSAKNTLSTLENLKQNVFATIVLGATAIVSLAAIPDYMLSILNVMTETLHIPAPIIWMLTLIISIFVGSKIIKAIRGNLEEA